MPIGINIWNVKTYRKLCINSRDCTGCIDKKMSAVVEMIQFGRQLEYFYAISNFSKSIIHTLKNSIIVTIVFGNTTTLASVNANVKRTCFDACLLLSHVATNMLRTVWSKIVKKSKETYLFHASKIDILRTWYLSICHLRWNISCTISGRYVKTSTMLFMSLYA